MADLRTPEERLLAKRRLGSFYLDDVRSLIAKRDEAVHERDYFRGVIQTALDHWPGEAHLGATYYALKDAIEDGPPSAPNWTADAMPRAESIERGRGIDESNARLRKSGHTRPESDA